MARGTFAFDTTPHGIADTAANVDALRRLWLDRTMIDGRDLGPGNRGDFDQGAWHVGCHVVAGAGVRRTPDGRLLWLEISWDGGGGEYFASVTADAPSGARTIRLDSTEGRELSAGSRLLGFVEGTSQGRISARGVQDPPTWFNGWQRQAFDRSPDADQDGGRVWEHWCTLRDIRATQPIATSVLRAYVTLTSALGDRFVPTVARGRRQYGHPVQLCAIVRAGLSTEAAATWETTPVVIPPDAEALLLEADPVRALGAAKHLEWGDELRYHMFQRRIRSWSTASAVRRDLREFRP